ncbi:MAG: phenylacetate--CoA ligase family protein [Deltaproteobacteria bacterium]|nr:MAG: phenylacetate--CoA ligase family protein [Deltaproteobacteria bacterium]
MRKDRISGFFNEALETMSPDQREEYRTKKLAEITEHAYKNSPAFKNRMDEAGLQPKDIKTISDLVKLPLLKKADLVQLQKKDLPFGGLVGVPMDKIRRIYISPGPIYEPWDNEYNDIRWTQAFYALGMRAGDIVQNTFSYHMVIFAFWLDEAAKMLNCTVIPMGVGNTEAQVEVMKNLKTTAYLGTPSFLLNIAERAEAMGLDPRTDLSLEVGFVAAEMLPESLRDNLEDKFGMTICQSYGTADVGCLGYECIHKNGMHIPEDCIVEIVDPDTGKQLPPGQAGEVVATVFDKAYPLIHFGTGDLSYIEEGECPCGRSSARLMKILGRVDQLVKTRGMFIHPGQVDEVAKKVPALARCQVVITRKEHKDEITFVAELKEEVKDKEELRRRLENYTKEVIKLRCEIKFVPPGTIPDGYKKVDDRRVWE